MKTSIAKVYGVAFLAMLQVGSAGVASANTGDQYGAIATSSSGRWGYSYNFSSRSKAEAKALKECGDQDCRIQVWFKNACGAVAKDDNGSLGWAWNVDIDEAKDDAISSCGTGTCEIVTWACTDR